MTFGYNDGGRARAGFKGTTNDCAVRAIAIAIQGDYATLYKELALANELAGFKRSVRQGMKKEVYHSVLSQYGFVWCPAPVFGGRKAKAKDLPNGIVIARQSKHCVCVVDGIPQDIFDSSQKMVYGYWKKA
jgi:hypothetical protein